jgi:hypothetical protein
MKKSELTSFIKEEIKTTLASENTQQDIKDTEELTKAVADLAKAKEEAGIEEANIGLDNLQDIGYDDGEYAVSMHFNKDVIDINSPLDYKYYRRGFLQGVKDSTASYKLEENAGGNFAELKKHQKMLKDASLFYINKAENLGIENVNDLIQAFNKGVNDLETAIFKADYERTDGKIDENEDKEPSKSDLKKTKGLAKAKEELAQLTKQMKSLARKYKEAEGEEKEKLVADLKKKTKLKKELEAIIDK